MYILYLDKRMYGNLPAHKVTDRHVFLFVFVLVRRFVATE
jgi:hypothetical protein